MTATVPLSGDEGPSSGGAVAWRYRYPNDETWQLTQDHDQAFKNTGEVEPLGVIPFQHPVQDAGGMREKVAKLIQQEAGSIYNAVRKSKIYDSTALVDAILSALPAVGGGNE